MDETTPKHVLIVDDDKFLLDMYSIKFAEQGFTVEIASDGAEALEKVNAGLDLDIYLIDILMPKMDGFELIGKLREKKINERATIIILSNLGQQTDIDRGLNLGVDGYIVKATATPSEVVAKTIDIANSKKPANHS